MSKNFQSALSESLQQDLHNQGKKKKGLDEFAIKRLVGHAISDITERVYTERDVTWLREEVNKL